MNTSQSVLQQKVRGTYERNEKIRKLYLSGIIENMAEIGRIYKLSRQAIRKIIQRP